MALSKKMLGIIVLLVTILVSFHYYTAHIVKGQLVPELLISVIVLYGLVAYLLYFAKGSMR